MGQASLLQVLQVLAACAARLGECQVLATVLLRAAGVRDAAVISMRGSSSRDLCVLALLAETCSSGGNQVSTACYLLLA